MRTVVGTLPALALLSLALAACGSGTTTGSGSDTTLPAVISVTPANGAKGVTADASIVFTFSEPMNQASTQAAYQSGDLPASGVTFSWNQDSTVMTVKPTSPLAYAQGSTFTQAAKSYAFSLTGNATDKAGNRLPLINSAFSTLRDITAAIPVMAILSAEISHDTKGGYGLSGGPAEIRVGDSSLNEGLRGVLTFDLSSIPTDVGAAPIAATIHLTQDSTQGTPYKELNDCVPSGTVVCASTSVPMKLDHVLFSDELGVGISIPYGSSPLHALGAIATAQSGDNLSTSVLVAVNDDLANRVKRNSRSKYRLSFPLETNKDNSPDLVTIWLKNPLYLPYLNVEYQIP